MTAGSMLDRRRLHMYKDIIFYGKPVSEWQKILRNEFSQYEIYRMAKDGCDLQLLAARQADQTSVED